MFAIIGTDYGAGNGSSTFNLPDLQDKVPVGVSGSKAVASTGGAATVTPTGSITINALTPAGTISGSTGNHTLTSAQLPSHGHTQDHGKRLVVLIFQIRVVLFRMVNIISLLMLILEVLEVVAHTAIH